MELVKINNLYLGYEKKSVIKNFSTNIEEGEIVSIIGPNGSGKSTILKSLVKLLKIQRNNSYREK